jgi:hypothetical protein
MVEEIGQGEERVGEGMHGLWSQPPQIEHPREDEVCKKFPSLFFSPTCWISSCFFFAFGLLPMAHSLLVQMDFLTHGTFFLG